ncbi:hypothetical protein QMO56_05910 [Roseomonas sp. E05]|uniref:hypothetical protein n=1 Tax=Roseomonas sp. E05 TaxID=3046310 RepID=UPI0024BAE684|nr:hypothetical protein [Roseomonas sp. E05]MDJ0387641.1 hypothetical protein [Roseomonas sp. E05]
MLPLMAAGLLAIGTASMTPASPAPRSGPAFQRVALEANLAAPPGCAESAPLFRSYMPSRVAYRPAAADRKSAPPPDSLAEESLTPAMHQAVQLCAVEKFDPARPFSGARKAVYRT